MGQAAEGNRDLMSIMGTLPKTADGCGAMAVEWVCGHKPEGEFKDISEARPGDLLFLADWGGRRISLAIYICDDRVATRSELRGNRVVMSRIGTMKAEGFDFAGGVHLGR